MSLFTEAIEINLKLGLNKANVYQVSPSYFLWRKSLSKVSFEMGMSIINLAAPRGLGGADPVPLSASPKPHSSSSQPCLAQQP